MIVVGLRVPLNTKAKVPVGKHLFIEWPQYIGCRLFCQLGNGGRLGVRFPRIVSDQTHISEAGNRQRAIGPIESNPIGLNPHQLTLPAC